MASAFQTRHGLRDWIDEVRTAATSIDDGRGGVVLTQVLSGGGGVGKSQLAAAYADNAIATGSDLVVWVDAATPGALVTAYAKAATRVQAPGVSGQTADVEDDARTFLDWAAVTDRSWLVVLDDITDPDQAADWWPASHTGTGWVLATTRRRDGVLSGGGRRVIDVDVYEPDEALGYLTERLTSAGKAHLLDERTANLAKTLGYLPLALSHAAAYMISQRIGCGAYFDLYTAGADDLDELMPGDPDGHGRTPEGHTRQVTVTLLLALDAASTCDPVGLARPAMDLAAVLDPTGHPETFWATDAVCKYLAAYRNPNVDLQEFVTPRQARAAILLLDRYGLATLNEQAEPRAVRVHALTARAARETTPTRQAIARTCADALASIWPDPDHTQPALAAALRANTETLHAYTCGALWRFGGHQVLFRVGNSLLLAGLYADALNHWEHTTAEARQALGSEHSDTLTAQANLATSYGRIGRTADAIALGESVAANRVRIIGAEHPDTLTAQATVASFYWQAGRTHEAINLQERVAADMTRIQGVEHSDTLTVRASLAASYAHARRTADAITLGEEVAADMERVLGARHPHRLAVLGNLGASYWQAGRTSEAILLEEQVAAERVQVLGAAHPETLRAQGNLAVSYWQLRRTNDAITFGEIVTTDTTRLLGPEHPQTLTAYVNLAAAYAQAERVEEAITLLREVIASRTRAQHTEHPETLRARANLAVYYAQTKRAAEAINLLGEVVADMERILGTEHPDTLTARANLALSYALAKRAAEAINLLGEVVADMERILGAEDPDTMAAQAMLQAWTDR